MAAENTSRTGIEASSQRMFGTLVESARTHRSKRRILALQAAIVAHALVLCAIFLRDYLAVPPITEPPLAVSFAQLAPPPPPPPPAAAPKAKPKPETPKPQEMTEPVQVPQEVQEDAASADSSSTGVEGGVAGGVEGGVEGGVVGSTGAPEVYRLGGPATPPQIINDVKPSYPRLALTAHMEGIVILEALIGEDGTVRDVKVLRGLGMGCTEAAVDAVKKRRYKPGMLDGHPVEFALTVTVQFRLG